MGRGKGCRGVWEGVGVCVGVYVCKGGVVSGWRGGWCGGVSVRVVGVGISGGRSDRGTVETLGELSGARRAAARLFTDMCTCGCVCVQCQQCMCGRWLS